MWQSCVCPVWGGIVGSAGERHADTGRESCRPDGNKPPRPRVLVPSVICVAVVMAALAGAWVTGRVVLPIFQADRAVMSCNEKDALDWFAAVDKLGGKEVGATKLAMYLRFPSRGVKPRIMAIRLIGLCGNSGKVAVPTLLRQLDGGCPRIRRAAAQALGRVRDARAVDSLLAHLADENLEVREAAAEALGEIGDPRAVQALIVVLESDRDDAQAAAAFALGVIGDDRAILPLVHALGSDWRELGYNASCALANIGPRAVGDIDWALETGDAVARRRAVKALGMIGNKEAAQRLCALLCDFPDSEPARDVREALVCTGKRGTPALLKALKAKDWETRISAAAVLGRISDPRALRALATASNDPVRRVAAAARWAHARTRPGKDMRAADAADSASTPLFALP
jgi:HEAT repeat protein